MVGQLLIEHLLQIRRAEPIGNVPIARMAQEELALRGQGRMDVLSALDILLGPVHHADVATAQRQQLVLENIARIRSLVHQIELGDDTDRPDALRVDLFGQLERITVGQIGVGGRDGQNQTRFLADELKDHALDLVLNVGWLIADRYLRQTGQIDKRQVEY